MWDQAHEHSSLLRRFLKKNSLSTGLLPGSLSLLLFCWSYLQFLFGNNDCSDAFNLLTFVKKRTAAQRRIEAGAEELREMNLYIYVHDIRLFSMFFFFLLFFLKKQSKTLLLNTLYTISALVENYFNNLQLHKICLQILCSILQALFVLLFAHVY